MTVFYSTELASIAATPPIKADATKGYGARLRRYRATITLASQTTSDTIVVAVVPAGSMFAFGIINTDTSLGSSTIAVGVTGATGRYYAAAVQTATNTPLLFGLAVQAGAAAPITSDATVFITIAAATMPASGTLVIDTYWSNG
jgi:hypothetical protein